ncbi:hypothetical protein [Arthrobacter sp. TMN-50]
MIDLHPVAAAPRMPADGPHCAGVGRVNWGAAGCTEVQPVVELTGLAGDWVDALAERRARAESFKGRHQSARPRPVRIVSRNTGYLNDVRRALVSEAADRRINLSDGAAQVKGLARNQKVLG